MATSKQATALLRAFQEHGATPDVARRAARQFGIPEQVAVRAASAFTETMEKATKLYFSEAGPDLAARAAHASSESSGERTFGESAEGSDVDVSTLPRFIRESAERMADQANKADADLRHASTRDLESLAAMKFGGR